jgi:predicted dehydrogenase
MITDSLLREPQVGDSMPDSRYRVAVMGHTGRGNYGHGLDVVWHEIPECEIVAVADADPPGLAAAQQRLKVDRGFADYRRMLDEVKPDVVSIATRWLDQHRDMVVAAAERGVHIYLEKPMCQSLEQADDMVAACQRHGVKLAIAFQTRYSPKLSVIRQLLEEGAIGRLLEIRGRGKEDARGGGEDLWVLGSHVMNLMQLFAGEPTWCHAQVLRNGRPITAQDVQPGKEGIGPLAGDQVSAMYGFDAGVTGYFNSQRSAGPGGTGRFGLVLHGEAGQLEVLTGYLPPVHLLQDPLWSPGRSGKQWVSVSSQGVGKSEPLSDLGLHGGNVLACRDLLEAIEHDRLPEANVYEARATVQMIAAVFESQRLGQSVPLPLENRQNPLSML